MVLFHDVYSIYDMNSMQQLPANVEMEMSKGPANVNIIRIKRWKIDKIIPLHVKYGHIFHHNYHKLTTSSFIPWKNQSP